MSENRLPATTDRQAPAPRSRAGIGGPQTPEGKAVVTMYKGPYSGMEAVYNEIFAWMGERKLEPRGTFYEFYYNSPGEVLDDELLTRIVIPVK